jgi:hypothetical protein
MGVVKSYPVEDIMARGTIGASDVQGLRYAFYDDGLIGESEADKLIALNRRCAVQDPAWSAFFTESITDYIVNQARPEGYITSSNAAWLIERLSTGEGVTLRSELDVVVNVIDTARWVPLSLVVFAIEQIGRAVATGRGPTRFTAEPAGTISDVEIELLRRIVYAYGSDGNVAVTRAEGEALFAINDALSADGHSPQWTDFFVKAITNVVMSASGYTVPSREQALAMDAALERPGEQASPAAMLLSTLRLSLVGPFQAYRLQNAEDRALQRLERQRIEIITGEEITADEVAWLVARLARGDRRSCTTRALIENLRRESGRIAPELAAVVTGA